MSDLAKKLAGRFIVLDGPDGSGKSTQIALLADWLAARSADVITACDPGGTEIGERIRKILLDGRHGEMSVACEMMLYMASRAQLVAEVIRPALSAGACVLCDRYVSATIAYQGAGGADVDAIKAVAEVAVGGTWPNLTVILDLPAEAGLERIRRNNGDTPATLDRMESKELAFHQKVREIFLDQARADPARYAVVDAAKSSNDVQEKIRDIVANWNYKDIDPSGPPIFRVLDSP